MNQTEESLSVCSNVHKFIQSYFSEAHRQGESFWSVLLDWTFSLFMGQSLFHWDACQKARGGEKGPDSSKQGDRHGTEIRRTLETIFVSKKKGHTYFLVPADPSVQHRFTIKLEKSLLTFSVHKAPSHSISPTFCLMHWLYTRTAMSKCDVTHRKRLTSDSNEMRSVEYSFFSNTFTKILEPDEVSKHWLVWNLSIECLNWTFNVAASRQRILLLRHLIDHFISWITWST